MTGLKRSLEESSIPLDAADESAAANTSSPQGLAKPNPASPTASQASSSSASSFRNVSACNRCRLRKNRCDQAGVKCVGYDVLTKREIPRRCVMAFL